MPGGRSDVVLKGLHTLFRVGAVGGLTDGQLLEPFLRQRDDAGEAAFRALIERHAPMVLRICRDVLADWHEAEDASQAAKLSDRSSPCEGGRGGWSVSYQLQSLQVPTKLSNRSPPV
jgi:hypothetical protein